jgi:oligopeptidase A
VIAANLQKGGLLNHNEVSTLFHEFGHLCHFFLSESLYDSLSWEGIALDFTELPFQLVENWVWERAALDFVAVKPLPDQLFARMVRAQNYETGTWVMSQFALAKLDLELHLDWIVSLTNYENTGRDWIKPQRSGPLMHT